MKKALLLASVALFAAASCWGVDLKLGHTQPNISPGNSIATMLKQKVEEKSKGDITITIFGDGTLGNEKNLQEMVRSGTADMAVAASFHHVVPWAGILECPLLFRNIEHFVDAFSSPIGGDLAKMFKDQIGVEVLFIAPHGGFRYLTAKDTPIRKPDDMKGLKIRNPNVPAYNIMVKAMGAVAVPLDWAEVYLALDRGVIQGQHNPILNIVGGKIYEVQGYMSMVPWGITPHIVCISNRAWSRLTPEQQKILREASAETAREYPATAKVSEAEYIDFLKDKITIIRPEEIDLDAFLKVFREKGIPELAKEYGPDVMKLFMSIVDYK